MGSNSAWLPSRRSVLHHTGTVVSWREGHWRFGRSMAGNGRYFLEGSLSMAVTRSDADTTSPRWGGGFRGSSLVSADWWRVCMLRLGRKKQERERSRPRQARFASSRVCSKTMRGRYLSRGRTQRKGPLSALLRGFEQTKPSATFMGAAIPCFRPSRTMTPLRASYSMGLPARRSASMELAPSRGPRFARSMRSSAISSSSFAPSARPTAMHSRMMVRIASATPS